MPKNQDSLNNELFNLLQSRGYSPVMLNTAGKEIPVPEEADVFQFHFEKDGEDYGTATVSIDGLHKLVVYFGDKIASSPKLDTADSESWYHLLRQIRRFAQKHQLSFETRNIDKLEYDMAKREHTKKLDEGYYSAGKKASISDNTPTVKMRIQHTREIQEGEQRFRNIARIFVENSEGERFLLPTNKPGLARVFARHIAEGGTPYDDRGQHIGKIVEEYQHMAGFVRATRNGQFNESAQRLVNEGINHYQKLRESLHKMAGKRGYNEYFENWSAPLMEDEEQVDLSEMFMSSSLDPRIENVMPILSKLSKNITETAELSEVKELEEWADSVTEGDVIEAKVDFASKFKKKIDKHNTAVVKTNKEIGTRVADIGAGGKEHNVKTDKAWDDQKGIKEADITTPARDEWNGIGPADTRGQTQYHQRGDQLNNMYGDFQTTRPARQSDVNAGNAKVSDYSMAVKPLPLTRQQKLNTTYGDFTNSFPANQSHVNAGDVDVSDYSLSRGVPTPKLARVKEDDLDDVFSRPSSGDKLGTTYEINGQRLSGAEWDAANKAERDRPKSDTEQEMDAFSAQARAKMLPKQAIKKPTNENGVDEGRKDKDDELIGGRYTQDEWDRMLNRLKQLAHKQEAEKKAKQAQPKPEQKTDESIGGPQQAAGQLNATSKVTVGGKILGEPSKSQQGLRGKLVGGATESVDPLVHMLRLIK